MRAPVGRLAALAAALCALASAAAVSAQATPPDSVTLRFAWPIGTEARVRYTQLIEREGDRDQPSRLEIEGELTMHVHEHPQGLLVEHLDPLVTRFEASPPLAADDPHRLVYARIGIPVPSYVVSKEGRVVGVEGVPGLFGAIAQVLGPEAGPSGALESLGRELLNETVLTGIARERWNALVGLWLDSSLKVGEPTGAESQEANPMVPSVVLPYAYRFELIGMEPCDDARPQGPKCARLGMLSLPDPVEFNRVMNEAMVGMGLTTMSFDGLGQHTQLELLADPATLLPYELTLSKVVEGILKEGDNSRVFRRIDGLVLVYTYAGG
jgi:hypothetical protein